MRVRYNYVGLPKTTGQITTARLPVETRYRLDALARAKNKTKSQIIKEALDLYLDQEDNELDSFTLGLPYFGKYGSGIGDLATNHKQYYREKLIEKHKRDVEYVKKLREEKERREQQNTD